MGVTAVTDLQDNADTKQTLDKHQNRVNENISPGAQKKISPSMEPGHAKLPKMKVSKASSEPRSL